MDEHGIEPKRDAGPRVSRRTFALGAVGACAVIGLGGVKYLPSATLLRPPGGLYDAAVLQQTACADLPVILWSVDPEDWHVHDADAVTAHILRHAGPGSVILMHDLTDSSVTAALRVIDALQAQGYEFLTVSELAARSGTALRPGQAYCSFPP